MAENNDVKPEPSAMTIDLIGNPSSGVEVDPTSRGGNKYVEDADDTASHGGINIKNIDYTPANLQVEICQSRAPSVTPFSRENHKLMTDGGWEFDTSAFTDADGEKFRQIGHRIRRKILLLIIGHAKQAPSALELQHYLANVESRATLEKHLKKLQEANLVKPIKFEPGHPKRKRDLPHKFWTLADGARGFLENHDVIPSDPAPLQGVIARTDKTDKIERYADAPRPGKIRTSEGENKIASEEIDEVLRRYKQTGDERQAGREITELEEENDNHKAASARLATTVDQLATTVDQLSTIIKTIESRVEKERSLNSSDKETSTAE
jgi:DNA-binding transcriptional ArsR family regulator